MLSYASICISPYVSLHVCNVTSSNQIKHDEITKETCVSMSKHQDKHTPYQDWSAASELRVPNATVKMAVDDKCNAEALEERSILRVLLQKQQFMAEAMRQRRLEACLGRGGKLGLSPDRQKPLTVPIGRRGRPRGHRRHNDCKDSAGEARFRSATQGAHPLLFMSEADLQSVELEQMRLEDAEATHLLR